MQIVHTTGRTASSVVCCAAAATAAALLVSTERTERAEGDKTRQESVI